MSETKKESLIAFYFRAPWRIKFRLSVVFVLGALAISGSSWTIYQLIQSARPITRGPLHFERPVESEVSAKAKPYEQERGEHEEREHEKKASADVPAYTYTYELKNLAISLNARNSRQTGFAQFSLELDLPSEASQHWIKLNRPDVMNTILETGARFTLEDFSDSDGLKNFKAILLETLQKKYGAEAPRGLSVKEWVVN